MTKKTAAELQIAKIDTRIEVVTKAIIEQMYADSLPEALAVAEKLKHEQHTKEVSDERAELAFLNQRRLQLVAK